MDSVKLDKIIVTPLKKIEVVGGNVLHGMKTSDEGFQGFGEAYFSWIQKGFVKAWKRHTRMTLNLIVPVGKIKLVFLSPEQPTLFREEVIGEENYARITVPPGLWFGFQGVAEKDNLLLNIANIIHEPEETQRKDIESFSYNWMNVNL